MANMNIYSNTTNSTFSVGVSKSFTVLATTFVGYTHPSGIIDGFTTYINGATAANAVVELLDGSGEVIQQVFSNSPLGDFRIITDNRTTSYTIKVYLPSL
ncbi:hypothetical protein [Romboutsia sp.]|uniref:hypothetical protein n=1 Tax=Romboutsia sp. TaxID=1965302 RepID=UPI003F2E5D4D